MVKLKWPRQTLKVKKSNKMVTSCKLLHAQTSYLVPSRYDTLSDIYSNDISFLDLDNKSRSHIKVKEVVSAFFQCPFFIIITPLYLQEILEGLYFLFSLSLSGCLLMNKIPAEGMHRFGCGRSQLSYVRSKWNLVCQWDMPLVKNASVIRVFIPISELRSKSVTNRCDGVIFSKLVKVTVSWV